MEKTMMSIRFERLKKLLTLTMMAAGVLAALRVVGPAAADQPKPIRIGMAKTFLDDQPKSFVEIATDDFKNVMKKTTGLDGELDPKNNAFEVAERLKGKQ